MINMTSSNPTPATPPNLHDHVTKPRIWTPRYLAYAAAHNRTPEAMLDFDEQHFPGGKMIGYQRWIAWAWDEWDKHYKHGPDHVRTEREENQFTLWLVNALVPVGAAA